MKHHHTSSASSSSRTGGGGLQRKPPFTGDYAILNSTTNEDSFCASFSSSSHSTMSLSSPLGMTTTTAEMGVSSRLVSPSSPNISNNNSNHNDNSSSSIIRNDNNNTYHEPFFMPSTSSVPNYTPKNYNSNITTSTRNHNKKSSPASKSIISPTTTTSAVVVVDSRADVSSNVRFGERGGGSIDHRDNHNNSGTTSSMQKNSFHAQQVLLLPPSSSSKNQWNNNTPSKSSSNSNSNSTSHRRYSHPYVSTSNTTVTTCNSSISNSSAAATVNTNISSASSNLLDRLTAVYGGIDATDITENKHNSNFVSIRSRSPRMSPSFGKVIVPTTSTNTIKDDQQQQPQQRPSHTQQYYQNHHHESNCNSNSNNSSSIRNSNTIPAIHDDHDSADEVDHHHHHTSTSKAAADSTTTPTSTKNKQRKEMKKKKKNKKTQQSQREQQQQQEQQEQESSIQLPSSVESLTKQKKESNKKDDERSIIYVMDDDEDDDVDDEQQQQQQQKQKSTLRLHDHHHENSGGQQRIQTNVSVPSGGTTASSSNKSIIVCHSNTSIHPSQSTTTTTTTTNTDGTTATTSRENTNVSPSKRWKARKNKISQHLFMNKNRKGIDRFMNHLLPPSSSIIMNNNNNNNNNNADADDHNSSSMIQDERTTIADTMTTTANPDPMIVVVNGVDISTSSQPPPPPPTGGGVPTDWSNPVPTPTSCSHSERERRSPSNHPTEQTAADDSQRGSPPSDEDEVVVMVQVYGKSQKNRMKPRSNDVTNLDSTTTSTINVYQHDDNKKKKERIDLSDLISYAAKLESIHDISNAQVNLTDLIVYSATTTTAANNNNNNNNHVLVTNNNNNKDDHHFMMKDGPSGGEYQNHMEPTGVVIVVDNNNSSSHLEKEEEMMIIENDHTNKTTTHFPIETSSGSKEMMMINNNGHKTQVPLEPSGSRMFSNPESMDHHHHHHPSTTTPYEIISVLSHPSCGEDQVPNKFIVISDVDSILDPPPPPFDESSTIENNKVSENGGRNSSRFQDKSVHDDEIVNLVETASYQTFMEMQITDQSTILLTPPGSAAAELHSDPSIMIRPTDGNQMMNISEDIPDSTATSSHETSNQEHSFVYEQQNALLEIQMDVDNCHGDASFCDRVEQKEVEVESCIVTADPEIPEDTTPFHDSDNQDGKDQSIVENKNNVLQKSLETSFDSSNPEQSNDIDLQTKKESTSTVDGADVPTSKLCDEVDNSAIDAAIVDGTCHRDEEVIDNEIHVHEAEDAIQNARAELMTTMTDDDSSNVHLRNIHSTRRLSPPRPENPIEQNEGRHSSNQDFVEMMDHHVEELIMKESLDEKLKESSNNSVEQTSVHQTAMDDPKLQTQAISQTTMEPRIDLSDTSTQFDNYTDSALVVESKENVAAKDTQPDKEFDNNYAICVSQKLLEVDKESRQNRQPSCHETLQMNEPCTVPAAFEADVRKEEVINLVDPAAIVPSRVKATVKTENNVHRKREKRQMRTRLVETMESEDYTKSYSKFTVSYSATNETDFNEDTTYFNGTEVSASDSLASDTDDDAVEGRGFTFPSVFNSIDTSCAWIDYEPITCCHASKPSLLSRARQRVDSRKKTHWERHKMPQVSDVHFDSLSNDTEIVMKQKKKDRNGAVSSPKTNAEELLDSKNYAVHVVEPIKIQPQDQACTRNSKQDTESDMKERALPDQNLGECGQKNVELSARLHKSEVESRIDESANDKKQTKHDISGSEKVTESKKTDSMQTAQGAHLLLTRNETSSSERKKNRRKEMLRALERSNDTMETNYTKASSRYTITFSETNDSDFIGDTTFYTETDMSATYTFDSATDLDDDPLVSKVCAFPPFFNMFSCTWIYDGPNICGGNSKPSLLTKANEKRVIGRTVKSVEKRRDPIKVESNTTLDISQPVSRIVNDETHVSICADVMEENNHTASVKTNNMPDLCDGMSFERRSSSMKLLNASPSEVSNTENVQDLAKETPIDKLDPILKSNDEMIGTSTPEIQEKSDFPLPNRSNALRRYLIQRECEREAEAEGLNVLSDCEISPRNTFEVPSNNGSLFNLSVCSHESISNVAGNEDDCELSVNEKDNETINADKKSNANEFSEVMTAAIDKSRKEIINHINPHPSHFIDFGKQGVKDTSEAQCFDPKEVDGMKNFRGPLHYLKNEGTIASTRNQTGSDKMEHTLSQLIIPVTLSDEYEQLESAALREKLDRIKSKVSNQAEKNGDDLSSSERQSILMEVSEKSVHKASSILVENELKYTYSEKEVESVDVDPSTPDIRTLLMPTDSVLSGEPKNRILTPSMHGGTDIYEDAVTSIRTGFSETEDFPVAMTAPSQHDDVYEDAIMSLRSAYSASKDEIKEESLELHQHSQPELRDVLQDSGTLQNQGNNKHFDWKTTELSNDVATYIAVRRKAAMSPVSAPIGTSLSPIASSSEILSGLDYQGTLSPNHRTMIDMMQQYERAESNPSPQRIQDEERVTAITLAEKLRRRAAAIKQRRKNRREPSTPSLSSPSSIQSSENGLPELASRKIDVMSRITMADDNDQRLDE